MSAPAPERLADAPRETLIAPPDQNHQANMSGIKAARAQHNNAGDASASAQTTERLRKDRRKLLISGVVATGLEPARPKGGGF
ncbi:hypothetical protein NFI95_11635 [Acetobacteraceae bacterium KSS8]|uniref:Uncharacterized protein n=1 Tax=Endosaccharibacter trunci TaxID=2812733 RepID=A0ABT1W892_9PROT|nr:hypothetical protein [Acetobacteraceae bacterium KSS8]